MGHERTMRPHVLLLNWRDTTHPEGGGSERYLETIASGLARRGYRVTLHCAAHGPAPADEWKAGVRVRRRGNRLTVYLHALLTVVLSRPDLVVDVQNGMPFFASLLARCPVVVLVHHVHKEQWSSAGVLLGRLGWWIESTVAPRLYRKRHYVTVSEVTRTELGGLGIAPERTTVVRPGLDRPPRTNAERDEDPLVVVVGRLVPHKRVEHVIDVVARLSARWPKLRLEVVGQGWWRANLLRHARSRGIEDRVVLHGWVHEQDKHEILARAWVHACPSVKEGWGIAIMEAAAHGVPSVAYRTAGGVTESIVDKVTGLLADDLDEFERHVDHLLRHREDREALGVAGRQRAASFYWEHGIDAFARLLASVRANTGSLDHQDDARRG